MAATSAGSLDWLRSSVEAAAGDEHAPDPEQERAQPDSGSGGLTDIDVQALMQMLSGNAALAGAGGLAAMVGRVANGTATKAETALMQAAVTAQEEGDALSPEQLILASLAKAAVRTEEPAGDEVKATTRYADRGAPRNASGARRRCRGGMGGAPGRGGQAAARRRAEGYGILRGCSGAAGGKRHAAERRGAACRPAKGRHARARWTIGQRLAARFCAHGGTASGCGCADRRQSATARPRSRAPMLSSIRALPAARSPIRSQIALPAKPARLRRRQAGPTRRHLR